MANIDRNILGAKVDLWETLDEIDAVQRPLLSRGAFREGGDARLVSEGHARVVVLSLVPACGLVLGVLVAAANVNLTN
jgi:hypothetical protein